MASEVPLVRLDRDDPALLDELLAVVRDVALAGAFTLGEQVAAFEAEFAAYCEVPYAVGVASGTDALALTLRALQIGPGDEVIVPANSFIATAEAVSAVGATPRFADVDPVSGLVTAEHVSAALGPRVRCIVPVHLYGATVDMAAIGAVAHAAGIAVVEDACQAHGARYAGERVGTIGDAGCFSFYPTKNLGGWGDGGAIVTRSAALADRVRLLRSHGERPRHRHRVAGLTARLDALQAAILRVKLRRLDAWNSDRRRVAQALRDALQGTGLELPPRPEPEGDHVYHLFVVRTESRDLLREHLATQGIASGVHYPVALHLTEAYADLDVAVGSLPASESLAARVCSLPMFPGMTDAQISAVGAAVRSLTTTT